MCLEVEERRFILPPDLTHLSWLSLLPRGPETGLGPPVLIEFWVPPGGLQGAQKIQASCPGRISLLLTVCTERSSSKINTMDGEIRRRGGTPRRAPGMPFFSCQAARERGRGCKPMLPSIPRPTSLY